jgi:hypothetical protein
MTAPRVVRVIWPQRLRCPRPDSSRPSGQCGGDCEHSGTSRGERAGAVRYERCKRKECGYRFAVEPIGFVVEDEDGTQSVVATLATRTEGM